MMYRNCSGDATAGAAKATPWITAFFNDFSSLSGKAGSAAPLAHRNTYPLFPQLNLYRGPRPPNRAGTVQSNSQCNSPSFFRKAQMAFSGAFDSLYFRGLEKGKRQGESLEGAAVDQAVFAIQLSILNRMSFLPAFLQHWARLPLWYWRLACNG